MLCNDIIPNGKSRDTASEHFTIMHLILLTKTSLRGDDFPPPIRPHYTLNPYTVPSRVPPIDEPCRRRKRNGRIVVVVIVVNGTPSIVSPAAVCVPEIIAAATVRMKTDFNHLFQSVYIQADQIKYYYTSEE